MAIAISSCFNGCAIDKFGFSLCEQVNLRVVCCISIRRTKSVRNCKFAINHVRRNLCKRHLDLDRNRLSRTIFMVRNTYCTSVKLKRASSSD